MEFKLYVNCMLDYDQKPHYSVSSCDMSSYGYTMVEFLEIDWVPPYDFDPVAAEVGRLRARIEAERAKCDEVVMKLQEEIAALAQLTYVEAV